MSYEDDADRGGYAQMQTATVGCRKRQDQRRSSGSRCEEPLQVVVVAAWTEPPPEQDASARRHLDLDRHVLLRGSVIEERGSF
jgi:hypothetical protein